MSIASAAAPAVHLPTSALTFCIAGITTRVFCDDPSLQLTVSSASRMFLVPPAQADAPDLTIRVERAPQLSPCSGELLFDSGGTWRMYRDRSDVVFSFVSPALGSAPYRLARFDTAYTRGTITFNSALVPTGAALVPLDFPLDELVMIHLLAQGRGLEVHGCGVIDRDGRAYLFAGQSEAGKSTIATFWHNAGARVLNDDRLVLRIRDGRVWMFGTPWHGDLEFASPASAPLTRLFFLAHGPENAARPIAGAAAGARLVSCCFPPFHDRDGLDFTLSLISDILDRVGGCELAFVPDPGVVGFVRGCA